MDYDNNTPPPLDSCIKLRIYSEAGDLVYEKHDPREIHFKGKNNNGEYLPDGRYFWYIDYPENYCAGGAGVQLPSPSGGTFYMHRHKHYLHVTMACTCIDLDDPKTNFDIIQCRLNFIDDRKGC